MPEALDLEALAQAALERGEWMIRMDDHGRSYGGYQWPAPGEWAEAPDWNDRAECGGGLHGQAPEASGFNHDGCRLVFCETDGPRVIIGSNKIKVPRARILLVDALPAGLRIDGDLYLSDCTGITELPDGLSVGGGLQLPEHLEGRSRA